MRTSVLPPLVALVLGAATALLVACGGDGQVPSSNAASLNSALDRIAADYRAGRCQTAQQDVAKAQNALLNLPNSVNAQLRDRLQAGIRNLGVRVPATCKQAQTQTQQTPPNTTTTDTTTTDKTTTTDTTTTDTTGTDTTGTGTGTGTDTTGTNTTTTGTDTGTGGASVGGGTTP